MPPTPLHEQILRMRFGKGEPPGSLQDICLYIYVWKSMWSFFFKNIWRYLKFDEFLPWTTGLCFTGDVAAENAKCWRPQCIGRWGKSLWHDRILVVIDGFCTYIFWIFFGLETWPHEKKHHNNDGKKVLQKRLLTQVLKSAKKGAEKAPNNTGAEKAPINTGAEKRQVLKKRQITEVLKSAKKGAEKAVVLRSRPQMPTPTHHPPAISIGPGLCNYSACCPRPNFARRCHRWLQHQ